MRRSQKILTLLRIQFGSANKKNKILAVNRAKRDVILKKSCVALRTRMFYATFRLTW